MGGRRPPGPPESLPGRVRGHLAATGLLPGPALVVAVSGGIDSMVLLHLLRFPLRDVVPGLAAAHLDHGLRDGSRADARWLRGVCRAWQVPLHAERLDRTPSSEAAARAARYAFLEDVAPSATPIATAHHGDDQAETVLFRAVRGTGIRGLRGIAPRRGRIIRPLLPFTRAELVAYADAVGLRWREDPTNRDPGFARNRLRHDVVPTMEQAWPGTARTLARFADCARAWLPVLDTTVQRLAEQATTASERGCVTLARPVLTAYDPALRAGVLRHVLRRFGSTPDRAGTQAALEFISSGPSGGELHVAGGVRVERDFDAIRVRRARAGPTRDRAVVIADAGPGTDRARVGDRWVDVVWGDPPGDGFLRASFRRPAFPLTVRGWRPGDRIRFEYGSKKLKKLFTERRVGRSDRRSVPVVVDRDGAVVWVVGLARAAGVVERDMDFDIGVRDA